MEQFLISPAIQKKAKEFSFLSFLFAFILYFFYKNNFKKLKTKTIVFIGEVFSSKKEFLEEIRILFHELGRRYSARNQEDICLTEVSCSFLIGCIWMLRDPDVKGSRRLIFKAMISEIIKECPEIKNKIKEEGYSFNESFSF